MCSSYSMYSNNNHNHNDNNNNNDNAADREPGGDPGQELLPKMRRQRVFQALSVPGAENLQKLFSVGPYGYVFSSNCSKSNDNP